MEVLASECSGGCESGWTLYLEQSLTNKFDNVETGSKRLVAAEEEGDEEEDEEEDLSMVSDASSGPPHHHFHEDIDQQGYFNCENNNYNDGCFYNPTALVNNGGKKIRQKKNNHIQEQLPSNNFLDDTASSPAFNFSKNNFGLTSHDEASMDSVLDYSQGFSATHFESPFLQGRSAYQDHHFGYIQPSLPGNQLQNNYQWL